MQAVTPSGSPGGTAFRGLRVLAELHQLGAQRIGLLAQLVGQIAGHGGRSAQLQRGVVDLHRSVFQFHRGAQRQGRAAVLPRRRRDDLVDQEGIGRGAPLGAAEVLEPQAVQVDGAVDVVEQLVQQHQAVAVRGAAGAGQAVDGVRQLPAPRGQLDDAAVGVVQPGAAVQAVEQQRRAGDLHQAEAPGRVERRGEQLQRLQEGIERGRFGADAAPAHGHQAAEAVQPQLCGGAHRAQAFGRVVAAALHQLVHGAGQLGLHQQRAQVVLALGFEQVVELAVGVQPARPVVGAVGRLRAAHQVAQRVDGGVAAGLQVGIGHLRHVAAAAEADVGQRLAHDDQQQVGGLVQALRELAEVGQHRRRVRANQAGQPGVVVELAAHRKALVAVARVQPEAGGVVALAERGADGLTPAAQLRRHVLEQGAAGEVFQVDVDVVQRLLPLRTTGGREHQCHGCCRVGRLQEGQAARLLADGLGTRVGAVAGEQGLGHLLGIVRVADLELPADQVVQHQAVLPGMHGGQGVGGGHGGSLGSSGSGVQGVRPPGAAGRAFCCR